MTHQKTHQGGHIGFLVSGGAVPALVSHKPGPAPFLGFLPGAGPALPGQGPLER